MNKISTGHDFEIDECIEDAAYLARNRILDTYPDVQTVHFWINQKTQRIRCEIALSKT